MSIGEVTAAAHRAQLDVFGAFHPTPEDRAPQGRRTLVLLGPREPGFWAAFTDSPEYQDGSAHPLDRWSTRVITALAEELDAEPLFPFGGPPYQPFISWAMRSGRAWQSPAGPLVHDTAGMMVSYRGALAMRAKISLPARPGKPCVTCATQPCLNACPVDALSAQTGYDLAACHGFLDTAAGADCMSRGCAARRACPVSQNHARQEAQSAFHMRSFHSMPAKSKPR
ncbi:Ferredoxin [Candidatus Rhodobacter oscarellae]|uniref:Ferredoxin n=1 Tax=Candidatus Rhodobacter oscarellae TaxID=1675527 RepID=A0A0J9E625_9RHOB|nr:hypothetical protein [Candidatus Rhodobacter lobularis]KMW58210.1 Ferredoxin [Candidatus Rhodobacter lobularis]